MKTYPAQWSTAQLAYFSGLISSQVLLHKLITMEELEHLIRQSSYVPRGEGGVPTRQIRFTDFVALLEPRISADEWASIVGGCQRFFK